MSSLIESVRGRRVWDSRGRPTVETEIILAGGVTGRAIAPAGASTGSAEAVDRRDGGTAFGGYDVQGALAAVNGEIAGLLRGRDACDQAALDAALIALDGTPNKTRLGGNATLPVSMAAAHAAAAAQGVPLWRHLARDARRLFPADAAGPDLRRRRACRASRRHPGLHGRVPRAPPITRRRWNGRPRSTAPPGC
jgi:enolase